VSLASALILWDESNGPASVDGPTPNNRAPAPTDGSLQWLTKLLSSELFSSIPAGNLQRVFDTFEPVTVVAGETVVQQGETGVYYYIIRNGTFDVSRRPASGEDAYTLAQLGPGDSFGEEALVLESQRNATVTALSKGELLRLTKEDFVTLVIHPDIEVLDWARALSAVNAGAIWLDIRAADEHAHDGLPSSVHMPLSMLRSQHAKLDRSARYIVYCNAGRRSAAACALLRRWDFECALLEGGLVAAPREPTPVGVGTKPGERTDESQPLHDNLARADAELETALRLKIEATAARRLMAGEADRVDSVEERSQREKLRLRSKLKRLELESIAAGQALSQAQRKRLEAQAAMRSETARAEKARADAAAQCEQLRAQAQESLRSEQLRIRQTYEHSETRISELARQRDAMETRFTSERVQLENAFNAKLDALDRETKTLHDGIVQARTEGSQIATRIKQDQDRAAAEVRAQTEHELRRKRERLEAEFAATAQQIEAAKQRVRALSTQREAADRESQAFAQMLREAGEERRLAAQAEVKAEQARLAQTVANAESSVHDARSAKEAAEEERQALYEELERLRHDRDEETRHAATDALVGETTLTENLSVQEARIAEAQGAIKAAEQAHLEAQSAADAARALSAEELAAENELRQQLYAEAEAWLSDENHRGQTQADASKQQQEQEQIERGKLTALTRASNERENVSAMFSDIQALLEETSKIPHAEKVKHSPSPLHQAIDDTPRGHAEREQQSSNEALARARAHLAKLKKPSSGAADTPGEDHPKKT
ncbi:MAG: rhodanese-related sulfurtransferase, partial [Gammaproteobacteria bacterium]